MYTDWTSGFIPHTQNKREGKLTVLWKAFKILIFHVWPISTFNPSFTFWFVGIVYHIDRNIFTYIQEWLRKCYNKWNKNSSKRENIHKEITLTKKWKILIGQFKKNISCLYLLLPDFIFNTKIIFHCINVVKYFIQLKRK